MKLSDALDALLEIQTEQERITLKHTDLEREAVIIREAIC